MHIDITERKEREASLKKSEERLRFVMSAAKIGYWDIDLVTGKVTRSLQHDQCFGFSELQEHWDYDSFNRHMLPDDRDRVNLAVRSAHDSGGNYDIEYRVVWADGSVHWLRSIGQFIQDETGRGVRASGIIRDITERKRIEEALVDSELELRGLAESMPQMVWMATPDGRSVYLNQRWTDYTGLSLKECQNDGWLRAFHPQDAQLAYSAWQEATSAKKDYSLESRLRGLDGDYRWMLVRGVPFRDTTGQVTKWIGTCTDIHDLKQTAVQLAASTSLLRMAGKIARIGGWAITVPDRKMSWSHEVFEIMEYPIGDDVPSLERAMELYTPDARQTLSKAIEDCMADGTPFGLELELTTAGNNCLWAYLVAEAVRDSDGNIVSVQGAVQDITAAKVAALAAQESAERLRVLSLATKDAIWDFDAVSRAFWLSDGFRELLGFGRGDGEMTAELLIDSVHPDDRDRMLARIRNAIAGSGEGWSDSYRIRRRNGSYLHVVDRGFLVREPDGKLMRIVGGITDISERLLLEEQLRQSQRLESLGQLTGGVAHDFNNLLGVISGNLELVNETLDSRPDLQEMLGAALRATERGATLTRSMLAFARQQPLDPRAVDPNGIVREMLTLLRRTLAENIEIKFVPGSTWECDVDTGQLQNALLNLAVNARDAMPDGGRLTLETADATLDEDYAADNAEVTAGDYLMLAVSDTGSGMPPDIVTRIFEPFFTTKEVGKGTGLGLSMVYGFAKQSLGHLKVYSEVGEGTTVRLYLPRSGGNAEPSAAEAIVSNRRGRGETILVVEDDDDMRIMTSGLLRSLGYSVLAADAAPAALDILGQSRTIDLLLTDVILPGLMNGRRLADEALRLRPNLKVVYMSGYTENAILHHGRLDPGVHLLQKPFLKRELSSKLREILG
jgi:PAS domain S-box-containing protein